MLTAEQLRSEISYDQETGIFTWRADRAVRPGPKVDGKKAGTMLWSGYLVIKVLGTRYYAHRLAWLYVHGEWPDRPVDHMNGDKSDNRFSNLRLATHAQNSANKKPPRKGLAPYRGVMPHGPGFVARIHHEGKRHYLGYFTTAEAASEAYTLKAKELQGEFSYRAPAPSTWYPPASAMGLGFAEMP